MPVIVLNDGWLGLMKVKQEKRKLSAFGGASRRAARIAGALFRRALPRRQDPPDEFRQALEWAMALGGPSVIEAFVDAESYTATVFRLNPLQNRYGHRFMKRDTFSLGDPRTHQRFAYHRRLGAIWHQYIGAILQGRARLSRAQVGLFFSAFYLAMTGASFVAGWLADRLGVRKTTLQGH